jgi:hypothetical protein
MQRNLRQQSASLPLVLPRPVSHACQRPDVSTPNAARACAILLRGEAGAVLRRRRAGGVPHCPCSVGCVFSQAALQLLHTHCHCEEPKQHTVCPPFSTYRIMSYVHAPPPPPSPIPNRWVVVGAAHAGYDPPPNAAGAAHGNPPLSHTRGPGAPSQSAGAWCAIQRRRQRWRLERRRRGRAQRRGADVRPAARAGRRQGRAGAGGGGRCGAAAGLPRHPAGCRHGEAAPRAFVSTRCFFCGLGVVAARGVWSPHAS